MGPLRYILRFLGKYHRPSESESFCLRTDSQELDGLVAKIDKAIAANDFLEARQYLAQAKAHIRTPRDAYVFWSYFHETIMVGGRDPLLRAEALLLCREGKKHCMHLPGDSALFRSLELHEHLLLMLEAWSRAKFSSVKAEYAKYACISSSARCHGDRFSHQLGCLSLEAVYRVDAAIVRCSHVRSFRNAIRLLKGTASIMRRRFEYYSKKINIDPLRLTQRKGDLDAILNALEGMVGVLEGANLQPERFAIYRQSIMQYGLLGRVEVLAGVISRLKQLKALQSRRSKSRLSLEAQSRFLAGLLGGNQKDRAPSADRIGANELIFIDGWLADCSKPEAFRQLRLRRKNATIWFDDSRGELFVRRGKSREPCLGLTSRERQLLIVLLKNIGRNLTLSSIHSQMYEKAEAVGDGAIHTTMSRLHLTTKGVLREYFKGDRGRGSKMYLGRDGLRSVLILASP